MKLLADFCLCLSGTVYQHTIENGDSIEANVVLCLSLTKEKCTDSNYIIQRISVKGYAVTKNQLNSLIGVTF